MVTLGAASLALALSATASHALITVEPGDELGLATGAPLPEGVFGVENELYGGRDGNPGHTGANVPFFIWATPWVLYDTRLQIVYGDAFFHSDSYRQSASLPGGVNTVLTDGGFREFNQFGGITLAHDFGNGFGASVTGFLAPPNARFITHFFTDLYFAVSYTGNGYNITGQFIYTGTFGSKNSLGAGPNPSIPGFASGSLPGISDAVEFDLTATKHFGKFEAGFVGYAQTDIENGLDNANAIGLTGKTGNGFTRAGAVALGGLIGYDFGTFNVQGLVTRDVATRGSPQLFTGTGKETRGLFRLTVPLYVAPAATIPAPLTARY